MLLQLLLLISSFVLLYFGAELALSSAEKVGRYFRLSPLVIGLLIIGFGTSLPEFFVSQIACLRGHSGIALGNIVGSNIANVYLIMAITAIMVPLGLMSKSLRSQLWYHLILTLFLVATLLRSQVDWMTSTVLLIFFAIYLWNTVSQMRKSDERYERVESLKWHTPVVLIAGFVLLYFGGELLISSGSTLGRTFGISEYIISVIFVAFGTSFPELVTAMVACYKKKDVNLITGNIIGSNIFNVAFVLMSVGWYKFAIPAKYLPEIAVLILAAVFFLFSKTFFRKSGLFFLGVYGLMIFYWLN